MERKEQLLSKFKSTRKTTEDICQPLQIEDYVAQPDQDISPPKWHLGHTSWFFEKVVAEAFIKNYKPYHKDYNYLFNSYYNSFGDRTERMNRGNLSRPTVEEVYIYRKQIDKVIIDYLSGKVNEEALDLIELGINHEQQHQELLITDIKYILGTNPLFPVYKVTEDYNLGRFPKSRYDDYIDVHEGVYEVGFEGTGFHFDNEEKKHKVYLQPYRFMDRLITNCEFLEFIKDKGYKRPEFWLSDGWEWVQENKIRSPLYWHLIDKRFHEYTLLGGLEKMNPDAPVTHISYYEADAYARWKGKRLMTEAEWETAAAKFCSELDRNFANFQDNTIYHPIVRKESSMQMIGDTWEWTQSAYLPYPYYNAPEGAVGEYNAKFMSNQMVLRGGSCATPKNHFRLSYRNFFQPEKRWQFTGIRLAEHI